MRWMWIDAIVECRTDAQPPRLVAVKNVSLAEDHLHDHFAAHDGCPAHPVMPGSLMIEGMAQSAGILVGAMRRFREKVILAKVNNAEFECEVFPGQVIRYEAELERIDDLGGSTRGVVSRAEPPGYGWTGIGRVDLMFSHVDRNLSGIEFPEENFVFSENFRTILRSAGLMGLAEQ
jgi:3-hydroxyacyl-[acyl-carrier-protein] dehydratase